MLIFNQKNLKIDNVNISYLDICDSDIVPRKTTFFLMPIGKESEFIKIVTKNMPTDLRIICPNYPGIENSGMVKDYTVESLAKMYHKMLDYFNFEKPCIIGTSMGGAILNEMLDTNNRFDRIVMLATGEFLDLKKRLFLNIFLKPFFYSEMLRKLFMYLVSKKISTSYNMRYDSLAVLTQIHSIYNYKIKESIKIKNPTLILFCNPDSLVDKDSKNKLFRKFENHKTLTLGIRHAADFTKIELDNLTEVVEKIVSPFIMEN